MARSKRSVQESRTAWLDESGHEAAGHATVLLAAVEVSPADAAMLRAALISSMRSDVDRVHWRDEHPDRRHRLLAILSHHRITAWVAVEEQVPTKQKEGARARCLAALLEMLDHDGVTELVVEGRPGSDHHDLRTIRRSRTGVQLLRFGTKREPMLWVADVVAGVRAGSTTFLGEDHARWGQELRLWTEHIRRV